MAKQTNISDWLKNFELKRTNQNNCKVEDNVDLEPAEKRITFNEFFEFSNVCDLLSKDIREKYPDEEKQNEKLKNIAGFAKYLYDKYYIQGRKAALLKMLEFKPRPWLTRRDTKLRRKFGVTKCERVDITSNNIVHNIAKEVMSSIQKKNPSISNVRTQEIMCTVIMTLLGDRTEKYGNLDLAIQYLEHELSCGDKFKQELSQIMNKPCPKSRKLQLLSQFVNEFRSKDVAPLSKKIINVNKGNLGMVQSTPGHKECPKQEINADTNSGNQQNERPQSVQNQETPHKVNAKNVLHKCIEAEESSCLGKDLIRNSSPKVNPPSKKKFLAVELKTTGEVAKQGSNNNTPKPTLLEDIQINADTNSGNQQNERSQNVQSSENPSKAKSLIRNSSPKACPLSKKKFLGVELKKTDEVTTEERTNNTQKPTLLEDIQINADTNSGNQQNERSQNVQSSANPSKAKSLIRNSSPKVCPLSKKKFLGVELKKTDEVTTQERSNNTSMSEIVESNKSIRKVTSSNDKLNVVTAKTDCSIKRKISPKQRHRLFKKRHKDLVYVDTDNSSDEIVDSLPETESNEQLKTSQAKPKINRVENESRDLDYIKLEDVDFLLNNTNLEEIILEKIKNKFPVLDQFNDKYLRTKFVRSWCSQLPLEIFKCLPCLEGLKLNEISMEMPREETDSQCNQKPTNTVQDEITCQSPDNSFNEKRLKQLLLKSQTYEEFKKNTNVQEYMRNDIMRKYPDTYNKFLPKIEKFMKIYYRKHFLNGDIPMELKLKDANESVIENVPENMTNNQKHTNRVQDDITCQSPDHSFAEKRLKELLLKSKTYEEFKKNTNVQEYMHNDIMRKYPDTYNKFLPKIEKFMKIYYRKHFLNGDIPMELKLKDANESVIENVPEKITRKKTVEEASINPNRSIALPLVMTPDQTIDKVFVDCDQNRTSSQVNPEQDLTQINQSVNLFPSSGESTSQSGKKPESNETISQSGKLQNDPLWCMNMGALPLQKEGEIVIDLITPQKESSYSRSNGSRENNDTVVFTAPLKADLSTARNNNECANQICNTSNRMNFGGEPLKVVSGNSPENTNSQICTSFLNELNSSKVLEYSILDDIDFMSQSENLVIQSPPKQIKTELDFSRYSDDVEYVPNDVTTCIEIEDDASNVSNLLKEMMSVGTTDKNNLFSPVKGTFQTSQSNVTDFDPKLMPQSTQEQHVNTLSLPATMPFQILEEIRILPQPQENINNVIETPVTENNVDEFIDLLEDTSSNGSIKTANQQSNNGMTKESRKRKAAKTAQTVTKIPRINKQSKQSEQCNKVAGYDLAPQAKHTFQPLKFRNEFVARRRRRKDHFEVDMLSAFRPKIQRSKNYHNNTDYFIEDVTQEIEVESESGRIGHSDMLNIDSSYFRSSQLENHIIVGQMYADTQSKRNEVAVEENEPQEEIICTEVPHSIIFAKEMSEANFVIEENVRNKEIESNNEQSNEIENELRLMRENQFGVGSHISEEVINLKQLNKSNVVLAQPATHTEHACLSSLPSKYAGIHTEDPRIPEELSKTLCITLREVEYSPENNSVNKECAPSANEENTNQTTELCDENDQSSDRDVCTKDTKKNETHGQIPSQTERAVETCDLQSSSRNFYTAEATSTVTDEQAGAANAFQEAANNTVDQHVITIQSEKPSPSSKPVYMILCEAEYDSANNLHCEESSNEQSIPRPVDGSSSMQILQENSAEAQEQMIHIVQNDTSEDNLVIQLHKGPLVLNPICITLCEAEYGPDENSESNEAPNEHLKIQSDVGNESANSNIHVVLNNSSESNNLLDSIDNQQISKQALVFRPLCSTQSEPVYVPDSATDRMLQSLPNEVVIQEVIEENVILQHRENENTENLEPSSDIPTDSSTDNLLQSRPNEVVMEEVIEENENTENLEPRLDIATDSSTDKMLQSLPNKVEMQEVTEENEILQDRQNENIQNSGPPLDIPTDSSTDNMLRSLPNEVEMQEVIEETENFQDRQNENIENSGPRLDIATDSSTDRTLQALSNEVEMQDDLQKNENLQNTKNESTNTLETCSKTGLDLDMLEQRNVYKKNPRDKFHQRTMLKKLETIQENDNATNSAETVPQPSVSGPSENRIDTQVVAEPQQAKHICSASCSRNLEQPNANIPRMMSNYRYGHITYLSLSKVRLMKKVDHLRYESRIPFLMPFEKHHMQAVIDFRNGPHHKLNFCGDSLRVLLGLSPKEWSCVLNLLNHIETFEYTKHDDEPHDRSLFHRILYYLLKTLPKFCQVTFEYDVTNINYSTSCSERRIYRKPFRCLSQAFSNEILETMAKVKRGS